MRFFRRLGGTGGDALCILGCVRDSCDGCEKSRDRDSESVLERFDIGERPGEGGTIDSDEEAGLGK